MVVMINKLPNIPQKTRKSKLDQLDTIALQSFNSNLSKNLHNLFLDNKNELNYATISLSWYIPCMKFMHGMNKAFAKLVKDLDYPITKWKGKLAEDYFTYTLSMLDGLNALSSLLSQVGLCRLTLSHAMNMITTSRNDDHLKPIIVKNGKSLEFKEISSDDGSFNCGKERVIHEAMMKMRGVEVLVLRVLVCGLCGEKSEEIGEVNWGEFEGFNMGFDQGFVAVKEIKEVNDVVKKVEVSLVGGKKNKISEVEELKTMLSELECSTEMVVKEVNCLFSEVLARRNELINCFRLPNKCN